MARSLDHALQRCRQLGKQHGVHSVIAMNAAGFSYTDVGDTAQCDTCRLEVSGWTLSMAPFTVHAEHSPGCHFVRSIQSQAKSLCFSDSAKPSVNLNKNSFNGLNQKRMVEAGFVSCGHSDRVLCLFCNLMCHKWIPHSDDPYEVHKTLSPQCPYIKCANAMDTFHNGVMVSNSPIHSNYQSVPARTQSFNNCPSHMSLPPVEELVQAGFFYIGGGNVVCCFYCGGGLRIWHHIHNPMDEHARWLPHCKYAKQLCGEDRHREIQKVTQRTTMATSNSKKSMHVDEQTLSRYITAHMDLPICRSLIAQNFQLDILRRCWGNQLRSGKADFETDIDLIIAYFICRQDMIPVEQRYDIVIPDQKMSEIHQKSIISITRPVPPDIHLPDGTEEKYFACVPCGHLHSFSSHLDLLLLCPKCGKPVLQFIRIYL